MKSLTLSFFLVITILSTYGKENTFEIKGEKGAIISTLIQTRISVTDTTEKAIYALIDDYALARETKDTLLLKSILTTDIDQLVSSGTWRYGIKGAIKGMLRSSTNNPGKRTLTIETIKVLNATTAIVDARYEIANADGSVRKMWSTFVVVYKEKRWKISAIRNMLPRK